MSTADFEIDQARHVTLTVTVLDSDGNAQDITGATAQFTLARTPRATALIEKTTSDGIALTTPASGVLTVALDNTDTAGLAGFYYYEVVVTLTSGAILSTNKGWLLAKRSAALAS